MIKKILYTIFVNLFTNGLSFLILILTARYFGASGRGIIAYTLTLAYFVGTLFSFTTGRTFIYFIHNSQKNALAFYKEHFANIVLLILAGIIFCLLFIFFFFVFNQQNLSDFTFFNYFWIFCLAINYLWQAYARSIFASIDKITFMNATTLIPNCLILFFLILTLYYHISLNIFIAVFALLNLLITFIQFYFFSHYIKPIWKINLDSIKIFFKKSLILHIDSMGGYLFAAVFIPLSAHYLTLSQVGFLQLSQQAIAVFMAIPQVLQLFIVNKIASEGINEAWSFTLKLTKMTAVYVSLIVGCCFLFSKPLVTLVFGPDFLNAVPYINLLSLTLFGNVIATLINPFWIARGLLVQQAFLTLFFGTLGILLALLLLPHLGAYGIIITLIFNYMIALLGNLLFIRYLTPRLHASK